MGSRAGGCTSGGVNSPYSSSALPLPLFFSSSSRDASRKRPSDTTTPFATAPSAPPNSNRKRMADPQDTAAVTVLLVDDERSLREPLVDYLVGQGFVVLEAESAAAARNLSSTREVGAHAMAVLTEAMRKQMNFAYGRDAANGQAMWFDEATYGVNRLVTHFNLSAKLTSKKIDEIPISDAGRESLKRFYDSEPRLEQWTEAKAEDILSSISYPDFLRQYGGLTEDAVQLFDKEEH
mgnify:CR=1 FL=1